ncbi:putative multiple sugar transport system permease protein [Methylobacterium brachiatum]|uniref:Xylose transport system permease protein XylH n=1 Tax=Methylobacterium brachiatum TaxID=269660 RepID=A0AAJ1WS17_9HYPH|nr:multiple monosaccharide ABC transporter permease [Methylobacterium brachiatum]MCB4801033.1 sugar ABC transporter permease [Methylobacterium brachiatum]MDQ0541199.1 putative multiple sugar transport system permease protein [Methylobacterium brachiatum]
MSDISAGKSMIPGTESLPESLPEAKPAADAGAKRGFLGTSQFRDYGLLIALLLITLFFEYTTNGVLFQPLNLTNLILQNSYVVVMALGMLLVIVAGHIDLSIGSIVGFVGALAALLMVRVGLDPLSATVVCLAVGAAIGGLQGAFVAYLGIPSFIVTLAGMLVFRGLTLALLQGASIGPFPEVFQLLAKGFLTNFAGPWTSLLIGALLALILFGVNWQRRTVQVRHGSQPDSVASFIFRNGITTIVILAFAYQMSAYRGLPNVLIVMFVLVMLYRFITTRTTIGRRIYALGGNIKAARLSGIKTERLTFLTFANMGALAGLAGMIFAARLNTATPKAGVGFELDVIAACFIGGASAAGGIGKVSGVVIGAFIIGVMNNGMSILGIGIDYQQVIKGVVLLAAVCLDVYNKKNRA